MRSATLYFAGGLSRFVAVLITLSVVIPCGTAWAQWSGDPNVNTPVAVEANAQSTSVVCSDGAGGAIIAWMDNRAGVGLTDIYAQRLDAAGNPLWGDNGVVICTAPGIQANPAITSDGAGGAFIAWQDNRTPINQEDIWAQRVDADGAVLWVADGVPVCVFGGQQIWPMLVPDDLGGAIITWEDGRNAPGDPMEIYAQRINSTGAVPAPWPAAGVPICTAINLQAMPMLVSDGANGAIITWYDWRNFPPDMDIYARRVDVNGGLPFGWAVDGNQVCGPPLATGQRTWPTIATDGAGGAIITWYDQRFLNWDIFAQRITSGGAIPPPWPLGGAPICVLPGNQEFPKIVSDGSGGAIITWQDDLTGPADLNIFAQRVDSNGLVPLPWPPGTGAPVCIWPNNQQLPKIVSDGAGGAIIAWNDTRDDPSDIYAQRLDANGFPVWLPDGVAISTAPANQDWAVQFIPMVEDGNGGAIITWNDGRPSLPATPTEIYAQNVNDDGNLGLRATVGYWRFEEGSGTTVADSSSFGNTGTFWDTGDFTDQVPCDTIQGRLNEYALSFGASFPGDSSIVEIPDSPSLRPTAGLTVEAWVRPRWLPSGAAEGPIVTKQLLPEWWAWSSFELETWGTAVPGGTRFVLMDSIDAGGVNVGSVTGPTLPADRWSHVAGTWDPLTETIRLYINFVQVGSGSFAGPIDYDGSPVLIGANVDGSPPSSITFGGEIDEVRISQVALEPADMLRVPPSCPLTPIVVVTAPPAFVFTDTLVVNSFFDIQWIAFDDEGVDSVTILYSTDAGRTFDTIATGEPNDSTFTWLVPDTPSDSCRVRIIAYDASLNADSATTVVYFRIEEPAAVAAAFPSPVLFASVPVNETTCDTISVVNNGAATMTIAGIYGCGASPFSLDTTMTAHSIDPGDTTRIVVCVTPTEGGPDSCAVTIVSNAANSPTVVPVRLDVVTAIGSENTPRPFRIVSVSPNPFNPSTTVRFTLPEAMAVTAEIWSVTGARVRVLSRGQRFRAGDNRLTWDGRNDQGSPVASGVYFVRVETRLGVKIARAVLLK